MGDLFSPSYIRSRTYKTDTYDVERMRAIKQNRCYLRQGHLGVMGGIVTEYSTHGSKIWVFCKKFTYFGVCEM